MILRGEKMKATIHTILLTLVVSLSANAQATTPSSNESSEVVVCKHVNALTEEEINLLNEDVERIVSFDEEFKEKHKIQDFQKGSASVPLNDVAQEQSPAKTANKKTASKDPEGGW